MITFYSSEQVRKGKGFCYLEHAKSLLDGCRSVCEIVELLPHLQELFQREIEIRAQGSDTLLMQSVDKLLFVFPETKDALLLLLLAAVAA